MPCLKMCDKMIASMKVKKSHSNVTDGISFPKPFTYREVYTGCAIVLSILFVLIILYSHIYILMSSRFKPLFGRDPD